MIKKLYQRILILDYNIADVFVHKNIMSKRRKRKIIPDEYFIDVTATIPERKVVVENIIFNQCE
ncbi:hypothetical protein [Lacrimispora saccharolytica]|uniref:Uncharacterized protein n=1 Tax=Lacrimispora saccharolytica (strain ATCC 35040 / DSM 2544 / NRCC 2533 / WM1) TaxID=610130 RepID=D9R064_LACSW|nr:hypothetical protein [Lacrimispora saccharolytica]ADL04515.1 hypothetical protein Closa_1936 [[Clostridium] saccharolyticum WM1]QRV21229.1 hypothetical protein I6K70_07085 [Lacrimispora saccharolytica]